MAVLAKGAAVLGKGVAVLAKGAAVLVKRVAVVVKPLDLDLQGQWFDPWCGHVKICTVFGPLSKARNPTLLQGVCFASSNQL